MLFTPLKYSPLKTDAQTEEPIQTASNTIRVLPDRVVNQIAAGEVVERPAAVVKELMENSLDAGATRIEVEFRNGGKSFIRIEDNGCGMPPDEAMMSLERHATSKLRAADDLLKITSLGFRGEALPSIASVSRFTLKTRRAGWDHGTEILVNGGKLVHQRECGMAPGTRIEVANLFNSVPARRKFLKTDATEAAHIIQLVRLHAVARPEVAFTLIENGRTVFQTPICPSMKDRVYEIWGAAVAKELIPLEEKKGAMGLRLKGLIGKAGVARSNRREMITLVNGRPVDSRTLNYALIEAYHTFIPKGRYPLGFLFLEIDPAAIDVNIHPAKREVRFRDEGKVRQFVLTQVQDTLRLQAQIDWPETGPLAPAPPEMDAAAMTAQNLLEERSAKKETPVQIPEPVIPPPAIVDLPQPKKRPMAEAREVEPAKLEPSRSMPERPKAEAVEAESSWQWRFVGRMSTGYALFETESGMVVMYLRAAHERIWFEKIANQFAHKSVVSQPLLVPLPLEFEPLASAALEEHIDWLEAEAGIVIEPFGRHFFRLQAHPDWLPEKSLETFIRDLVATLSEKGSTRSKAQLAHAFIAEQAATRAVRFRDDLTETEIVELAQKLLACEQPLNCPKGRRTFFEMPTSELEKRFGK